MSGYVASARIRARSARLARAWGETDRDDAHRAPSPPVAWIETPADDARPGRLHQRWTAVRERWSQLTFFLFDPNSWR